MSVDRESRQRQRQRQRTVVRRLLGEIAATDPYAVKLSGEENATEALPILGTAAIGDLVNVLKWGHSGLILGTVGTAGPEGPEGPQGPMGPEGPEGPPGEVTEAELAAALTPEAVTGVGSGGGAPAFGAGWGNAGSGAESAGFYKAFGRVHLRGMVTRTSGSADLIFTLPSGYRPGALHDYAAPGGTLGGTYGAIRVASTGTVTRVAGAANFLSLDGISFRV